MFFNIATQQTSKNQCKIKKYSQCSGFRSKRADFRSENAEYRSGLEDPATGPPPRAAHPAAATENRRATGGIRR